MNIPQQAITGRRDKPWDAVTYRLVGLAQITRVHNCLLGGAFALVGAYLGSTAGFLPLPSTLQAALVVFLCVGFGNVVNDYRDVSVDALSKPDRPIPSGRLTQRAAGCLALTLAVATLIVAMTLGAWSGLFALMTLALSAGYSYYWKSTLLLGNAIIALLDASVIVYGSMAVGSLPGVVGVAALLFFLHVLAHEVLYTVRDQSGDALAGLNTTATRLGARVTIDIFRAVALVFVVCAFLPWLAGMASDIYLYAIVLCAILPTLWAVLLLSREVTLRRVLLALWVMKSTWFFSVVPILLLR